MYIPYLNASKFQITLKSRKGHPFPYWTQVIAGSLQPFVSTGVTPLGTRHWKKYPSCILLLPYNSVSVNYVPIRNHMKRRICKRKYHCQMEEGPLSFTMIRPGLPEWSSRQNGKRCQFSIKLQSKTIDWHLLWGFCLLLMRPCWGWACRSNDSNNRHPECLEQIFSCLATTST